MLKKRGLSRLCPRSMAPAAVHSVDLQRPGVELHLSTHCSDVKLSFPAEALSPPDANMLARLVGACKHPPSRAGRPGAQPGGGLSRDFSAPPSESEGSISVDQPKWSGGPCKLPRLEPPVRDKMMHCGGTMARLAWSAPSTLPVSVISFPLLHLLATKISAGAN